MTLKELDQVGASMYLTEVRELCHSVLDRIERIEAARAEWLVHRETADSAVRTPPDEFPLELFNSALHASREQQGIIFDTVEALLTAWARLSLVFHPICDKSEAGKWREERGRTLRYLLDLSDDTLLSKRDVRDAWMHFDERLDAAFQNGWLGNRQIFTKADGTAQAIAHTVRVIDVETLALHYRTKAGDSRGMPVVELKTFVEDLVTRFAGVPERLMTLPPPITRN